MPVVPQTWCRRPSSGCGAQLDHGPAIVSPEAWTYRTLARLAVNCAPWRRRRCDRLLVGFSRFNRTRTWPVTRSSEDRGASWGPAVALPTANGSRVTWGGYPVVSFAGPDHVLALFTSCVTSTCRKTRLHGLRTGDLGDTWPDRFMAGGSAARFLYPSGIEGDGRVVLSFIRVTASGSDLLAQAVQVDEPAPAGTRGSRP